MKNVLRMIGYMLISLVVGYALSLLFKPIDVETLWMLLSINIFVILGFVAMSAIFYFVMRKIFKISNLDKVIEKRNQKQDKLQSDYKKIVRRSKAIYLFGVIYYTLVGLIVLSIMPIHFALVRAGEKPSIIYMLIALYTIISLLDNIFKRGEQPNFGLFLPNEKFPIAYEIIGNIKSRLNVKEDIYLYVSNIVDFTVTYYKRAHHISMSILVLQLYSKDELEAILYHEVAHVIYRDSYKKFYQKSLTSKMHGNESDIEIFSFAKILFTGVASYIEYVLDFYDQILSITIENRADDIVKEQGISNSYISAGLKLRYLDLYLAEIGNEIFVPISETLSDSFYRDVALDFISKFPNRKEIYEYIVKHEIKPKSATHPLIRERMNKFNVNTLDVVFDNKTYDSNEVNMIVNKLNENNEDEEKAYQDIHNDNYVSQIKIIEAFEAEPKEDELDVLNYAYAYYQIGKMEKAFSIFKEVLAKNDDSAQAHNGVGYIYLLYYYDKQGVYHLETAAKLNQNFVNSLEEVGNFFLKMGLADEYEDFKKVYIDKVKNNAETFDNLGEIIHNTKLSKPSLDESLIKEINEFVRGLGFAKEVFIVRKDVNIDYFAHLVCVVPKDDLDDSIIYEGMNSIFRFLDIKKEQYALVYVDKRNKMMYKKLLKVMKPEVF